MDKLTMSLQGHISEIATKSQCDHDCDLCMILEMIDIEQEQEKMLRLEDIHNNDESDNIQSSFNSALKF